MEISKAAQEELYLHIRINKELEKSLAPAAADFTRGYYAGHIAAMEIALDVLGLKDDFKKWSEEREKN